MRGNYIIDQRSSKDNMSWCQCDSQLCVCVCVCVLYHHMTGRVNSAGVTCRNSEGDVMQEVDIEK